MLFVFVHSRMSKATKNKNYKKLQGEKMTVDISCRKNMTDISLLKRCFFNSFMIFLAWVYFSSAASSVAVLYISHQPNTSTEGVYWYDYEFISLFFPL